MTIDLTPLWDFADPAGSAQRFEAALAQASGDDALVLRTQIARSHGLRRDFATARRLLLAMAPAVAGAGPEVQVRHALELGRTQASATHPPGSVDAAARAQARDCFVQALALARQARLDALAIDAVHMLAFVDTAPAQQLHWAQQALDLALASDQADAHRWQASIRNNLGLALHRLGRFDDALDQFRQALVLREQAGQPAPVRVARWMVAWTLRGLGRGDEALALQLALERDGDAAGEPDPYVFEELEALYQARGDAARAAHYALRRAAASRRASAP